MTSSTQQSVNSHTSSARMKGAASYTNQTKPTQQTLQKNQVSPAKSHPKAITSQLDDNETARLLQPCAAPNGAAAADTTTTEGPYRRAASPHYYSRDLTRTSRERFPRPLLEVSSSSGSITSNRTHKFQSTIRNAEGMMNSKRGYAREQSKRREPLHRSSSQRVAAEHVLYALLTLIIVVIFYKHVSGSYDDAISIPVFAPLHDTSHIVNSTQVGLPRITTPNRHCRSLAGPGNSTQVCCRRRSESIEEYCYPSIVVAGAQKAGTTALHSYLLFSSHMRPSSKKELHAFDLDKNFEQFPRSIFRTFKPTQDPHLSVTFESTPSYMAGPVSCQRIADYLPPSTVIVLLVRDPIKRAWSEIQMKARRIANQEAYYKIVLQNLPGLWHCIQTLQGRKEIKTAFGRGRFSDCAQEHTHKEFWGATKFNNLIKNVLPGFADDMEMAYECFEFGEPVDDLGMSIPISFDRSCFTRAAFLRERMPAPLHDLKAEVEALHLNECLTNPPDPKSEVVYLQDVVAEPLTSNPMSSKSGKREQKECRTLLKTEWCSHCISATRTELELVGKDLMSAGTSSYRDKNGGIKLCFAKCVREMWPNPMWTEHRCEFPLLGFHSDYLSGKDNSSNESLRTYDTNNNNNNNNNNDNYRDLVKDIQQTQHGGNNISDTAKVILSPFTSGNEVFGNMTQCEGPMCQCFPKVRMPSDISKGFIWRGMYYFHLAHCLKSIPSRRIVVLETEELRNDPQASVDRIMDAAGLPRFDVSGYTHEDIHNRFVKEYPTFEEATGWTLDSEYDAPSHQFKALLRKVYKGPNELFFELVGRRFDHWLK